MRAATRALLLSCLGALLLAASAAPAHAAFGFEELDVAFSNEDATPATLAGSHPFLQRTTVGFNTEPTPDFSFEIPSGDLEDLSVVLPPGLVADTTAIPRCPQADFVEEKCEPATQVGVNEIQIGDPPEAFGNTQAVSVYNLVPSPGTVARLGFVVIQVPISLDVMLSQSYPYGGVVTVEDAPQAVSIYRSEVSIWGVPADSAHDAERSGCVGGCDLGPELPFLTMPTSCREATPTAFSATSWQPGTLPASGLSASSLSVSGCEDLEFEPTIESRLTGTSAESPTGIELDLEFDHQGLLEPEGRAQSATERAVVTLPEGLTANPSAAEGLEACDEDDLGRETLAAAPGEGCPNASKLGTAEVETPLLADAVAGSVFLAEPYENPFQSLLAVYVVLKDPGLGILVKQPVRIEPDPRTGRLVGIAEEIPQLPFSRFRLRFREGPRAPLVSPPRCGEYAIEAGLFPWSAGLPATPDSAFAVSSGRGGSPCPLDAAPPFAPGFEAGSEQRRSGAYTPFHLRLTRSDGDQDLTRFSAKLPPGLVARLAGTSECSDAAIAVARGRTGPHGGKVEIASPSCPAAAQIGRVVAGAGVGDVLTYVSGRLYLAGPYRGAPLSVVAIVPAVAGPFDLGTVVVREALRVDPRTVEVEADGSSDPIPRMLAGIPLKLRDIRVEVDRPHFTLNPTSCEPFAVRGVLWGVGTDALSEADDSSFSPQSRFQVADCNALGFKPKLALRLKGGTRRNAHPALIGTFTPRPGDANLAGLVLSLPASAFLEQAHIRTICTRVQFAAAACPPGAVYGHATAYTPLLSEPLSGPVFLRSSDHPLPDLVADLHGQIDVEAVARIDSRQRRIRATFTDTPDAPLTKVVVRMQGGRKGLIVNSRNLCARRIRADAEFTGHNGKVHGSRPTVKASCGKGHRPGRHGRPER
ncbi:MAG TPA: hypothetical protein VFY48_01850 [Solirubrobacterales bacterium]|nr:hypothetical protein [Solirubrobacterales bacterium]